MATSICRNTPAGIRCATRPITTRTKSRSATGAGFAIKTGTPVEWVEEESYFFKLSAYASPLLEHYEAHPDFISAGEVRNEIVAFVKRGLNDLSISRTTFDWGIPVPGAIRSTSCMSGSMR